MGSNQSEFGNDDGATMFFFATDGTKLYDYTQCEPENRDGCRGLKLFFESKDYIVPFNGNYSQFIHGWNGNIYGFTFNDFKQEIDDGNPVLIHTENHTMIGFGYDDSSGNETIYFRNTWDFSYDEMTWGGIYQGSPHLGITVVHLEPIQLTVSPEMRTVGLPSGSTTFFVDISGSTSSTWTAEVVLGQDWMQITSGSSGVGNGVITVHYDELTDPNVSRFGEIVVTCPEATYGSPASGIVMQLDATNVHPGESIQAAIDNALSGVVITVHPGIYVENIIIDNKDITVESLEGPQNTIIQGVTGTEASSVVTFLGDFCDGAWLKGFTLKGGVGSDFGDDPVLFGGGIYCHNAGPTLENLLITDNTTHRGGGLACNNGSSPTLLNVTITNNHATTPGNCGYAGAIHCEVDCHPVLLNTIVYDNTSDLYSETEIYFYQHGVPNSITIDYSDIKNGQEGIETNENGDVIWGEGNTDENPFFCELEEYKFWLQETSPCIDTGHPAIFDDDDTRSDMGCYPSLTDIKKCKGSHWNWVSFPRLTRSGDDPVSAPPVLQQFTDWPIPLTLTLNDIEKLSFDDGIWYPLDYLIKSSTGYKLRLGTEGLHYLPLEGSRLAEDHQIDLYANQNNCIGYWLPNTQMSDVAFGEQHWGKIRTIKAEDYYYSDMQQNRVDPTNPVSWNPIPMEYGKGYIVRVHEDIIDFQWHNSNQSTPAETKIKVECFSFMNRADYEVIDIIDIPADIIEIGVFEDSICVGAVAVKDSSEQILVYSDNANRDPVPFTFEIVNSRSLHSPIKNYEVFNRLTGMFEPGIIISGMQEYSIVKLGEEGEPGNNVPLLSKIELHGNYPNPFNPETTISFSLPAKMDITLTVYNIKGQKVKTLIKGFLEKGNHKVIWNGIDEDNNSVASGIYFCKLKTGGKEISRKMLLLK
ncbi:MAG: T9SS type A sorting domain-containing protein [Armatimonadetes bacterium]|nr:T9SS type A sorting domain-containing protein [Armatimonadota bacterium]